MITASPSFLNTEGATISWVLSGRQSTLVSSPGSW